MFGNIGKFIAIKALGLIFGVGAALAAPGDIDPSFGEGGIFYPGLQTPIALGDARFAFADRTEAGFRIQVFGSNGEPDATFGTDGSIEIPLGSSDDGFDAGSSATGADGALVLLGHVARTVNGVTEIRNALLRVSAAGVPDPDFGTGGDGILLLEPLPSDVAYLTSKLAVLADGGVLIAAVDADGDASECVGSTWLLRLQPDGQPDPTFGASGWVELPTITAICGLSLLTERADGSILVADVFGNLRALRPEGTVDSGFGDGGALAAGVPGWNRATPLPDGGLLLLDGGSGGNGPLRLARVTAAGQLDTGFGNGGALELDLASLVTEHTGLTQSAGNLRLSHDGQFVYLSASIVDDQFDYYCYGVARLRLDGALDGSFGRDGLSCVSRQFPLELIGNLGGGLLVVAWGYESPEFLLRLLDDDTPSPGILSFQSWLRYYGEGDGTATIVVARSGGRSGALSVDYRTVAGEAAAGADFESANGRLEWADGDDSDRIITVALNNDTDNEADQETFRVNATVAAGDAPWVGPADYLVGINDDDASSPPPPPVANSGSGGGGSTSWFTLALLALLATLRHASRRRVRAALLAALAGLAAQAALAAPGDIDPSFGDGGTTVLVGNGFRVLDDGRLATARTDGTSVLEVRMLSASGQPDGSFGTAGVASLSLPDPPAAFNPVASTTDGSLLLLGGVTRTVNGQGEYRTAVVKLDPQGALDAGFGANGDGLAVIDDLPEQIGFVTSSVVLADGSLLIAGTTGDYDYCSDIAALIRLRPDGTRDDAFGGSGTVLVTTAPTCTLDILGVRADGSIMLADRGGGIWALNADGSAATGFGNGGFASAPLNYYSTTLLLPDGGLLLGVGDDTGTHTRLVRLDAAGAPDAGFGNGGELSVDLSEALTGDRAGSESLQSLGLAADGQSIFAWAYVGGTTAAPYSCMTVAQLALDGTFITTFGRGGVSCVASNAALAGIQPGTGQPLVTMWTGTDSVFARLLLEDLPSPGVISLENSGGLYIAETQGTVTLRVLRSGGRDGPVSVDYATVAASGVPLSATADEDFEAVAGRFDWADGEDGTREITIRIIDDSANEGSAQSSDEAFALELSNASGSLALVSKTVNVFIQDGEDIPPPAPSPSPVTSSGGGGTTPPFVLLALLALALAGCGSGSGSGGSSGGGGGGGTQPLSCTELAGKTIADATIQSSGETTVAGISACQANARTGNINFQVTIPCDWNGKLLYIGGGGFNGSIPAPETSNSPGMLGDTNCSGGTQGYAIVASDSGHQAESFDASWALGNEAALDDWAFRAVHVVQAAAREIVARHKGTAVSRAYFEGCSNGGREALIAAQRYPDDFDGIVARAPSTMPSGTLMWSLGIVKRLAAPDGPLPTAKIALLDQAELAACDLDDGAADGILGNPAACTFDPATLRCPGADTGDCLTDGELATIALIRADVTLQHAQADGVTRFGTLEIGHESDFFAWPIWLTEGFPNDTPPRPPLHLPGLEQYLRYIVTGDPALDILQFDPVDHLTALERESRRIDATNADLGPYFASGGKLILWHGRVDSVLPIGITTDYVERVRAATGTQANESLRFYTAPGVTHCQWGPGADTVDLVTPLDAWVSNGTPPGTPVARRYPLGPDGRPQVDQAPLLSRPLCEHPQYPHYNGAGDLSDAASFSCRAP